MPGVGGGAPVYETYTGGLSRPTPDNVWVPFMLFPSHIVTVRDKRDALANVPEASGSQAYVYPVAEVRRKSDRHLVATVTLADAATMASRTNWQLYYRTPLVAKGAWNDGAPWIVVWSVVRKISPSTIYARQVTVSWPTGFEGAYTRTVVDAVQATAGETLPSSPLEAGSAAIASAGVAWGTADKLVFGGGE